MDQSSQSVQEATRRWLAGLLAQRELGFYDRLAARARWRLGRWNAYWAALPRRGRRAVGRRLAPALLGASLLGTLVLTVAPVHAAAITVVNGEVAVDDNNVCSIVEAIENANDTTNGRPHNDCAAGDPAGADTVTLPLNGFFSLVTGVSRTNFTDNGLPYITSEVTIEGQGSTISRHYSAGGDFRLLAVAGSGHLTINDATLQNGRASDDFGGGIWNSGILELNDSAVTDNYAETAGGLANFGDATLHNTTIAGNSSRIFGGGIRNDGMLVVESSTLSGNFTQSSGGALGNGYYGVATIVNSTLSNNRANGIGGGIRNSNELTLINSTITRNSSGGNGGALSTYGTVTLSRSIISYNYSQSSAQEIYNDDSRGVIIANDYNVIGHSHDAGSIGFSPGSNDIVPEEPPSAVLADSLADNGGPTLTHALPAGSPAIDIAPTGPATDQRGEPRPAGAAFDAGAYEAQGGAPANPLLYLSPRSDGVAGGIPIKTQDIAAHDPATGAWAMYFDGSDVGVNKPIAAFTRLPDDSLLLAFTGPINLPGVNGVTPSDIVRFTPSSTGDVTTGTFELYFDGSDVGLSTSSEKIDAIDATADGKLLISTTGNALVPLGGGVMLKAQDEDLLAFAPTATGANTAGTWSLRFDGTAVPGLAAEDVAAAHLDEATGDLYLAVLDGFNVDGVTGKGKDILKLSPNGGGYTVSRFWRGADNGFNLNIGGLEME